MLSVLAVTGALAVSLTGLAPAAVAAGAGEQQWYLDAMQMESVWKESTGEGVKVAVVDTGVDDTTPSLQGQLLPGKDVADAPGGANDDDVGHGTAVAELIAGTGKGGGLKGLAPDSKIIPVRAGLEGVKGSGDKSNVGFTSQAIRAAADSDAKIINLSFGTKHSDEVSSEVVKYAAAKGKLLIASTGNEGEKGDGIEYPAAYPEVVAVGATDKAGKASEFSQWVGEDDVDSVDLVAPGEEIPSYCKGDFERYCEGQHGTSFASALASASAALIWSKHPDWTANQVLRVMIDTAGRETKSKSPSKYIGYGAVRPRVSLVDGQGDPGAPDVSPLTGKKTGTSVSSGSGKDPAADKAEVADSSKPGVSSQILTIAGVGAGVVVVLVGAFVITRMRRNQM